MEWTVLMSDPEPIPTTTTKIFSGNNILKLAHIDFLFHGFCWNNSARKDHHQMVRETGRSGGICTANVPKLPPLSGRVSPVLVQITCRRNIYA